jgi:hypothetical protein
MTITLAALVATLQEDVPAVSGVPSDAQYERAIKDAVIEFSRRCGLKKTATISVIAGTADYALPDDFLAMIEMESPYDPEHQTIVTSTGIIPFGSVATPFEEELTIRNKTLTIVPTPTYTMDRFLEYKAGWALVVDSYDLTDDEAQIVMLKAKALVFDKMANANVGGFQYSVGNMSVNKSATSDTYTKRMYELHGDFVKACDIYNGSILMGGW